MTGILSAPRSFAGPIPDRSNNLGESIAPAARITSCLACTVLVSAFSIRHLMNGERGATLLHIYFHADSLLSLEQYLGDASLGHDGQVR